MDIELEIIDNVVQPKYVELKNGKYMAKVTNIDLRTQPQNNAMWLWFTQIANKLNNENITTEQILRPDIKWDSKKFKAMYFDSLIETLYNKKSSTKLNKDEFELIILTLTKAFGQRGVTLPPFPSIQIRDRRCLK